MIFFNNLNFVYKDKSIIFKDTKINIIKNKITGIIGPSGSGKSTLLYLLAGLYKSKNTEIYIKNKKSNSMSLQKITSIVDQHPSFLEATLKENIAFGIDPENIDYNHLNSTLKKVQLSKFSNHKYLSKKLNEYGSNFSGGEKQRISLARAIYFKKEVLLLDEITNGLNLSLENKILDLISKLKQNSTVVFITHNKNSLRICDHIFEIHEKKLKKL